MFYVDMEPAYFYKLPSGTSIFRAETIAKEGRWYSLSLEDAYVYGKLITEYKTTKDLNLINISSLTFHNDFMDRLNVMFPGINFSGISEEKLKCLIPLGLIDLDTQKESIHMLGNTLHLNTDKWNNTFDFLNKLMLNRHRFSTHELDTYLVSVLKKIYSPYYDGYISPVQWASKVHGNLFPRELCTFELGNVSEIKTHLRPHIGGGINTSTIHNTFKIDTEYFNKIMEEFIKTMEKNTFQPFWNPHTELPIHTKRNITRKNKRK